MKKDVFSPLANGIIQGLNEAIEDANNKNVVGMKKSTVYRIQPKKIREQLNMSQSKFASTFGIPLSTLKGWEQGKPFDTAIASYLRTIMKFPNEVQQALSE